MNTTTNLIEKLARMKNMLYDAHSNVVGAARHDAVWRGVCVCGVVWCGGVASGIVEYALCR